MITSLPAKVDLDFAQISLFQNHAYLVIKEGVVIDTKELNTIYQLLSNHYIDQNFGYISDRQFDFSVNPNCYKEVVNYPRLKSIAVLCHKESTYDTANFEKTFYNKPFAPFYSIEECQAWVSSYI